MKQTRTERNRIIQTALYIGMGLTFLVTLFPFIDHATTTILADHIRSGYPTYSSSEVDRAVTVWMTILSIMGILGVAGWWVTARSVEAGKEWSRWAAAAFFGIAMVFAITVLTTRDTSGDIGLAPTIGWLQVFPLLPGVVAVAYLWRDRTRA